MKIIKINFKKLLRQQQALEKEIAAINDANTRRTNQRRLMDAEGAGTSNSKKTRKKSGFKSTLQQELRQKKALNDSLKLKAANALVAHEAGGRGGGPPEEVPRSRAEKILIFRVRNANFV